MITGSKRKKRTLRALRYLTLIVGSAIMIVPFLYMFATSFKPQLYLFEIPPQFIPKHPTLSNYTAAWTSNSFEHYFANSVFVSIVSTGISVLLAAMMAYAFARFNFRGQNIMFWMLLIGLMVPGMMLLIPQYLLANQLHLMTHFWGSSSFMLQQISPLILFYYVVSSKRYLGNLKRR